MIIRGMNNFFGRYSRWIFGIFTVVIIISFMGIMTPGQYSGCFMNNRNNVGTVFGENVTYDDLRDVMISTQVFYQALYGFMPREIGVQEAFLMYAQLKAAEQRGIVISDKEVASYIKSIPSFQKDGKFDRALYSAFLQNLSNNGITESDLIKGIRNQFMLNRLAIEIQNSVIVTDNEVENFYRILNEKITVKVAEFKADNFKNIVKVNNEELKNFFEANRDNYMVEAKAKALVAVFDFNNAELLKKVNAMMTPEALEQYYNNNKALFTVTDKDGSKVTPFKEALEAVKSKFRAAKARELASNQAQFFARDVYEKSTENPSESLNNFKQMVKEGAVKVIACDTFSSSDTKLGGIDSPALVKEVFNSSTEIPITNAVIADNAAYVAYVLNYSAPRRAELAEVLTRITADFANELAMQAAKSEAEKIYGELKALNSADMAKKIQTMTQFGKEELIDVKNIGEDMTKAYIFSSAKTLPTNEISQILPSDKGVMIVYVIKREMPKLGEEFAKEKESCTAQYKELKVRAAMNEFLGYLDKQCMMIVQN
ncbi:MAG: SurA N-terminal domain-containing protein [Lentisphaeria bacterium]|nr:SurA N-terminal domain-containing protein [Lentisphaeria bacterium]